MAYSGSAPKLIAWTPILTFGGNAVGLTYNIRSAYYAKIGSSVILQCTIQLTSVGSSTGGALLTAIPFNAAALNSTYQWFYIQTQNMSLSLDYATGMSLPVGTNYATLYQTSPNASGPTQLNQANFTNTSWINFSIKYEVQT